LADLQRLPFAALNRGAGTFTLKNMRKIVFLAVLVVSLQLVPAAVRSERAAYVGGSAAIAKDAKGTFDFEDAKQFRFQYAGGAFAVPYERITRIELGDNPGRKKKNQLLTITFQDEKGIGHAVIFEVPEQLALVAAPIFEARTGKHVGSQPEAATPPPAVEMVPVTVTSKPTGAFVSFWGQVAGKTPVTTKLAPGNYTVTVEADGLVPWTREIVVESGKALTVSAELAQPVRVTVADAR
jgi:PEGA domain-containing protein